MSDEREPLWSDIRIRDRYHALVPCEANMGEMEYWNVLRDVGYELRNAYEARIAELEAQLSQTWQPLPDGEYNPIPNYTINVYSNGSQLEAWAGDIDKNPVHEISLLDYRLCRLVESQPTLTDHEREIIEAMAEDWIQLYEPGSNEWADAQVIVSWLNNYRGTFADEIRLVESQPQPTMPPDVRETMRALIRFADTMQWTHSIGVSQAATLIETWLDAQGGGRNG